MSFSGPPPAPLPVPFRTFRVGGVGSFLYGLDELFGTSRKSGLDWSSLGGLLQELLGLLQLLLGLLQFWVSRGGDFGYRITAVLRGPAPSLLEVPTQSDRKASLKAVKLLRTVNRHLRR